MHLICNIFIALTCNIFIALICNIFIGLTGLGQIVRIHAYVYVSESQCVFVQSVGSQVKEVVCMCDEITSGMVYWDKLV